jgi:hypothetical protein
MVEPRTAAFLDRIDTVAYTVDWQAAHPDVQHRGERGSRVGGRSPRLTDPDGAAVCQRR